jgi:hypothetical protein
MGMTRIKSGKSERVYSEILVDSAGNLVIGLTGAQLNMLTLMRKSDGKYYDGAAWQSTKTDLAVIEQDAINSPGLYYYDTPILDEDEYFITINTIEAANVPQTGIIRAGDYIDRLLGLSYENMYMHTRIYTGGQLTSAKIDLYNNKANADIHDGSTGIVAKYTQTFIYIGTELSTFKMVRDS